MTEKQASEKLEQLYFDGLIKGWWQVSATGASLGAPFIRDRDYVDQLDELEQLVYGRTFQFAQDIRNLKEFEAAYQMYLNAPLIKALS